MLLYTACKGPTHCTLHMLYTLLLLLWCVNFAQQSSPQEQLASTTVAVLGLLFGLFTICMLFDQFSNLETGLTKVSTLHSIKMLVFHVVSAT
jgi:hypothetical protein